MMNHINNSYFNNSYYNKIKEFLHNLKRKYNKDKTKTNKLIITNILTFITKKSKKKKAKICKLCISYYKHKC